jgi:hypothetical protein
MKVIPYSVTDGFIVGTKNVIIGLLNYSLPEKEFLKRSRDIN